MGLFTIGHGNSDLRGFVRLLESKGINILVDVRSTPYSKYANHFNRDPLSAVLKNSTKILYLYRGAELGGRPTNEEFSAAGTVPDYSKMREDIKFKECLAKLMEFAYSKNVNVALMCSEENPEHCHRNLLIGDYIFDKGYDVIHIRRDGNCVLHSELMKLRPAKQMDLL